MEEKREIFRGERINLKCRHEFNVNIDIVYNKIQKILKWLRVEFKSVGLFFEWDC